MKPNPTPTPLASTAMEAAREIAGDATNQLSALGHRVPPTDLQAMCDEYAATIQKHLQPLLAKVEGEAAEAKRVIGGVRHENERLRGVERTLRKQVEEFEKLFGLDTPWTVVSLYKSLVIAESKFREDGRDFDGWESIQAAAAVAQQRVSDFLKP